MFVGPERAGGCMLFGMPLSNIFRLFNSSKVRAAWLVAIAADSLQILIFPVFVGGALSPADVVIDVVVALLLSRLIGWHWAFMPTLVAELVPALDLFPTWTAAVFYVTWQRFRWPQPHIYEERLNSRRFLNS
jgi:hypothetical protein